VEAVGGDVQRDGVLAVVAAEGKHLVSLRRILFFQIEPDAVGVALFAANDVGAGNDVEGGFVPVNGVRGGGIAGGRTAQIPELEEPGSRVIPDAVAEGHGVVDLPCFILGHHGVGGVHFRFVKSAVKCSGFDQEIIDEELAADVNGNDRRRVFEIGHGHGLPREGSLGRPLLGEANAVVEEFAFLGGQG